MKKIAIWLFIAALALYGVKIALAANNKANNNSNNSATVAKTIYSESSDPLTVLTQNRNFVAHGLEIKDTNEVFGVTRSMAIQKAATIEGQDITKQASSITAVKGNFTDNESPKIPESNIILKDYPVWIVTFHDVTLPMDGPLPKNILADLNVIIDGNTAEFLGSFAYNK